MQYKVPSIMDTKQLVLNGLNKFSCNFTPRSFSFEFESCTINIVFDIEIVFRDC